MGVTRSRTSQREQRLNEVLAEYLEAVENGRAPDRAALLRAHPDLAEELESFLDNRQCLQPLANNPAAPPPTAPDLNGPMLLRLGDYDLLQEIARGGMGIVYRARQRSLNRIVAIKTIRPELTDAEGRQRFLTEAEVIGRLDSPHIVTVYEFGEIDQQLYFSMQYLAGGNLAQWAERQGWTGSQQQPSRLFRQRQQLAAALLATVARAVQHAHDQGVLHRDLKPANILLMAEPAEAGDHPPEPVVTDFGLAKVFRRASQITQSMSIVGTACYMAPEQAFPSRFPLTVAADVYSLGAILYFLLAGRPPFVGETPFDTLLKAVEEPPTPLRQIDARVDPVLEKIVLRCLNKEPAQRYRSAAALAQDLENWRRGDPVTISPPTRAGRLRHWFRRRPVAAGILLASCLGLVLLAIALSLGVVNVVADRDREARRADTEKALREQVEKQAQEERDLRALNEDAMLTLRAGLEREHQLREDNNTLLARLYVGQGMEELEAGNPTVALVWLTEALQLESRQPRAAAVERVRIAEALRRCPRLIQAWFPERPIESVLLSPEARKVVLLGKDRTVQIGKVGSGELMTLPDKARHAVTAARWPLLAYLDEKDNARLLDLTSGQPTAWQPTSNPVQQLALSPDGKRLALADSDNTVSVRDPRNGRVIAAVMKHSARIFHLVFSPDGRSLAAVTGPSAEHVQEVRIWTGFPGPLPTSTVLKLRPGGPEGQQGIRSLAFSGDGKSLLTVPNKGPSRLWDAATGKLEFGTLTNLVEPAGELLGPQTGTILTAHGPQLLQRDLKGHLREEPVLAHAGVVRRAAFSSDGRRIVTVAATAPRVWNALTGEPLTPSLQVGAPVKEVRLSMNGLRLVVLTMDSAVKVYNLTPRNRQVLAGPSAPPGSVLALSPDGHCQVVKHPDGTVSLWDGHKGRPLPGPNSQLIWTQAVFSRDGRWLATSGDRTVRIWDTLTAKPTSPDLKLNAVPWQMTFDPERPRLLVLDEGNELRQWTTEGKVVHSAKVPAPGGGGPAGRAGLRQLSPDGRFVVLALIRERRQVEMREATTGRQLGPAQRGLTEASCLAFRDDGQLFLAGFKDGKVGLWQTETGEPVQLSLHHPHPVERAVFGPAPLHLLATAQTDGVVIVWDVDSGLPVTPPLPHAGPVAETVFTRSGDAILTRTRDGTVTRWPLTSDNHSADDLVWMARALAGQRLLPRSGGLELTEPGYFKDLWPQLRREFPHQFSSPD